MFKYLRNSDVALRVSLNPFFWKWIPDFAYEPPTPVYPKRRTVALVWLGVQFFIDIDDGTHDTSMFQKLFHEAMDIYDEQHKVGQSLLEDDSRSFNLE